MDKKYLDIAFDEAEKSYNINEVPVGAVIVKDNQIISMAHNLKESNMCSIYHAEMIAIKEAAKKLHNWRLYDCDIYVTLDPCPMCASAIKQSRIKNVYSANNNSDFENIEIIEKIFAADKNNPSINFVSNLDVYKSTSLLQKFFNKQRKK